MSNSKISTNRIFHHYKMWEDHKHGFYNNMSGEEKEIKVKKVVKMFNSESLTRKYMFRVIKEWRYSCEHNLTNDALNRIAYIGQAACCLYDGIPSTVTMEAWSLLNKDIQDRSDSIAIEAIKEWEQNNKSIQLCLNFD